ncbi:hypothetical protein AKJ16_DCAP21185, partial [Drosera capensis]
HSVAASSRWATLSLSPLAAADAIALSNLAPRNYSNSALQMAGLCSYPGIMSRLVTRSGETNSSNPSSCKCFGSSSRIVACEGLGRFSAFKARWECVKSLQWLWNNNTEERNRLQCRAVEAGKGYLFEAGNKFQLEDVIEAQ